MVGSPVASINAQLGLDSTQFNTGLDKASAKLKTFGGSLQSTFAGVDFGKALDKVFDASRLAVLDEGAARIKIFGSALEPLGALGIAAGAGIAALGAALETAKSAAEYAEVLSNTASKLGITTKALQEYQYAAVASGVSTEDLRKALQDGNEKLGEFQSNLGNKRLTKVFEALGITPEEAATAKNITDLIPEISEKMQGLSAAEQTAVAKRAGLEDMLAVLQKGPEAIADLRKEAEASGAVLDTDIIAKGKAAAESMKEAGTAVDVNLKRAFIGLAPFLEDCMTLAAKFAKSLADAVESLGPVSAWSRVHVNDEIAGARQNQAMMGRGVLGAGTVDPKTGRATGGIMSWAYNNNQNLIDKFYKPRLDELDKTDAAAEAKTRAGSSNKLVADQPKADHSAEYQKAADTALDTANKNEAQALAALTDDIAARAQFEKDAVDAETKKTTDTLTEQQKKIDADKNLSASKKQQYGFELELAKAAEEQAATTKKELIDRKAQQELAAQALDYQITMNGYDQSIMKSQASIAADANKRADLEIQAFKDAQNDARDRLTQTLQDKVTNGGMSADAMQAQLDKYRQDQNASLVAYRSQQLRSANPLYALANPLSSVSDELQTIASGGLKNMNDELAKAFTGTEKLGDAFHNITAQILQDLAKLAIEKAITEPLANVLGGLFSGFTGIGNIANVAGSAAFGSLNFSGGAGLSAITGGKADALGTSDAPSGTTLVGEHGPELLRIPSGSQVVPNDLLGSLARSPLNDNDDTGPQGVRVEIVDTTGLFKTKVTNIATPIAAQAGAMAAAVGSSSAQATMTRRAGNRLGRS